MTQVLFKKRSFLDNTSLEFDNPSRFFDYCIEHNEISEFAPLDMSTIDDEKYAIIQKNSLLPNDSFTDITDR